MKDADGFWEERKGREQLREYIFMTPSGYRHFYVLGADLKDAEKRFLQIDEVKRCGFTLDDLPIRLENCPDVDQFSMDDFWKLNENRSNTHTS